MAVQFNAAADRLTHSGAYPQTSAGITITAWVRIDTDLNDYQTFFRLANSGSTVLTCATASDGLAGPENYVGVGSAAFGDDLGALVTWVPIAVTRSSDGATARVYRRVGGDVATTVATQGGLSGGTGTPNEISVGGRSPGDATERLEGSIAYLRIWSGELTEAQIETEWISETPVHLTGLHSNWPLANNTDLTDTVGSKTLAVQGGGSLGSVTSPTLFARQQTDLRYQHIDTTTAVSVDAGFVPELDIDSTPVGVGDLAGVDQEDAPVGGVLTATAVTSPGTSGALVTGWQVLAPAFVPLEFSNQSGRYHHPVSQNDQSTSASLTNGTLRLAPWLVPFELTIDRLGAKITVVGESGSKLRLGIYSDNGHTYPGALLLDAGQIAGDSATAQDITLGSNLVIPAGLYWIGGAVQSVTTTQPTVEITNDWTPPVPLLLSTSIPAAGATSVGYAQTGVTGALPGNFTSTVTATGSAPRCHVRLV